MKMGYERGREGERTQRDELELDINKHKRGAEKRMAAAAGTHRVVCLRH